MRVCVCVRVGEGMDGWVAGCVSKCVCHLLVLVARFSRKIKERLIKGSLVGQLPRLPACVCVCPFAAFV